MQGLFIGDDHTPPESLRRYLETQLKTGVSILNTGHLGYSPEQYYYTLLAFEGRFRPQFVVVSIFANDFGDVFEVPQGHGDWEEGNYWLQKIAEFCSSRQLIPLFVVVPLETQMSATRKTEFYPGKIANMLHVSGTDFLNPVEAFVNTFLETINAGERQGRHHRAVRCSTSRSMTVTFHRSARRCGRRPWDGDSRCSWNGIA